MLGINAACHDLPACLIRDARVIAAAEKEQLTGILERRGLPVVSGLAFLRRPARGLSVVLDLPGHLLKIRRCFLRCTTFWPGTPSVRMSDFFVPSTLVMSLP